MPRPRIGASHRPRTGSSGVTGSAAFADDDGSPGRRGASREQNRRQALAPGERRLVVRPPGFEQLHELLAGAVVVPLAVTAHDVDQLGKPPPPLSLGTL